MTREEAIDLIKGIRHGSVDALGIVLNILEQEPCEDAISRKDVINAIDKWISEYKPQHYLIQSIRDLPSVTQKSVIDDIRIELINEAKEHMREGDYNDGVRFGLMLAEQIVLRHRGKEQKSGKWITVTNGRGGHECSLCHEYAPSYQDGDEWLTRYCPNCGAKMESEVNNG